jgi:hypothetical protein
VGCRKGHEEVRTSTLIRRISTGRTPLAWATETGYEYGGPYTHPEGGGMIGLVGTPKGARFGVHFTQIVTSVDGIRKA